MTDDEVTTMNTNATHTDADAQAVPISDRSKDLMRRGEVMLDHDRFCVYEHPDYGDHAPMMVYDKALKQFHETTPFWDADDPDEYLNWLLPEDVANGV